MGYDPVAYFTDGRAVKGRRNSPTSGSAPPGSSPTPSTSRPSPRPRSGTRRNTAACAPWAWPMARSVNIDPEAWRIVDGKLYLFFGNGGLEQDWDPHPEAVVAKADANWPAIEAKLAAR